MTFMPIGPSEDELEKELFTAFEDGATWPEIYRVSLPKNIEVVSLVQ